MAKWASELDYSRYEELDKDAIVFCFQQSEKRLVYNIQLAEKITNRIYIWIIGLLPLLTVSMWVITRKVLNGSLSEPLSDNLLKVSWFALSVTLLLLTLLFATALPQKSETIGRDPSQMLDEKYLLNPDFKGPKSYLLLLIYEMNDYQLRIDNQNVLNKKRTLVLKSVFIITMLVLFSYFFVLASYYWF